MNISESQKITQVREGEEFDKHRVRHYLKQHVIDFPDSPLEVMQFSTGVSNLTYMLRCGNWEGVLRRPPNGPLPPKAHDMKRESEFLFKLHPYFSYVPKPFIFCDDQRIIGVPFYVMEWKKGIVIDEELPPNLEVTEEKLQTISLNLVDALTQLHSIDYQDAGLAKFGHPDGFINRQVHGWIKRYQKVKTEEIPYIEKVEAWLINQIPQSNKAAIIHNDYKLNNMLISEDLKEINAILDWEMVTIGDPYFDLGGALVYWMQNEDPDMVKESLPSITAKHDGFISREEFLHRYAIKTNADIPDMRFYMSLNYYKLAVALQQIYHRWKSGKSKDERFATFNQRVKHLIQHTYEIINHPKRSH